MSGTLPPCPASPNCVSSDAVEPRHKIAPLVVTDDFDATWTALLEYLQNEDGFTVVQQTQDYIQAEARTRWLRFVDDVVFAARPEAGLIAVRSASRLGYSDLGANRKRVEKLRAILHAKGLVSSD